jgi:hypothetical protein
MASGSHVPSAMNAYDREVLKRNRVTDKNEDATVMLLAKITT